MKQPAMASQYSAVIERVPARPGSRWRTHQILQWKLLAAEPLGARPIGRILPLRLDILLEERKRLHRPVGELLVDSSVEEDARGRRDIVPCAPEILDGRHLTQLCHVVLI